MVVSAISGSSPSQPAPSTSPMVLPALPVGAALPAADAVSASRRAALRPVAPEALACRCRAASREHAGAWRRSMPQARPPLARKLRRLSWNAAAPLGESRRHDGFVHTRFFPVHAFSLPVVSGLPRLGAVARDRAASWLPGRLPAAASRCGYWHGPTMGPPQLRDRTVPVVKRAEIGLTSEEVNLASSLVDCARPFVPHSGARRITRGEPMDGTAREARIVAETQCRAWWRVRTWKSGRGMRDRRAAGAAERRRADTRAVSGGDARSVARSARLLGGARGVRGVDRTCSFCFEGLSARHRWSYGGGVDAATRCSSRRASWRRRRAPFCSQPLWRRRPRAARSRRVGRLGRGGRSVRLFGARRPGRSGRCSGRPAGVGGVALSALAAVQDAVPGRVAAMAAVPRLRAPAVSSPVFTLCVGRRRSSAFSTCGRFSWRCARRSACNGFPSWLWGSWGRWPRARSPECCRCCRGGACAGSVTSCPR